jgi:hypothetical protein
VAKALNAAGRQGSSTTDRPVRLHAQEFKAYIKQESAKYAKPVKAANIRLEN